MKRLLLTAILLLSVAGIVRAEDGDTQGPNKSFYSANSLYEKRDYARALEEYLKILETGVESGPLYYNIANCYFKSGKLGYAILYYEKARRIMPHDGDLKANLNYARSLVQSSTVDVPRRNPVVSLVKAPFRDFSINAIAILALIAYLVFVALQITGILNPVIGKKTRLLYAVFLALLLLSLGAFAIRYYDEAMLRRGVVVRKGVEAKYEPIDKSTTFYKLQEGDRVSILNTRDGWRRVRRIDGKAGWVDREAVSEI